MSNLLYFDAFSGLAGDMTLGALLHLGLPFTYLQNELSRLGLSGYRLEMKPVEQHHISGIKLEVVLEDDDGRPPVHRSLSAIDHLLNQSSLPPRVIDRARLVFQRLAEAEGRIHNIAPEAVHFHEVGAVDAIVDITGACIGFEYFDIDEFYCGPLPLGSGFVQADHGLLPLPAPATLALLSQAGAMLAPALTLGGGVEYPARGEMVTPTGAALVAALVSGWSRPAMTLQGTGYGFGSKDFAWPNALRVWLGSRPAPAPASTDQARPVQGASATSSHSHGSGQGHNHHPRPESPLEVRGGGRDEATPLAGGIANEAASGPDGAVSLLETNLDDMTPEGLGYLLERLMAAEALDVFFTPIQMKKNRPATMLSVLARLADEARLAGIILAESSTFGVRCSRLSRYTAGREFRQVVIGAGAAQVKLKILEGRVVEAVPEYESVAALARQSGRPWREIYEEVRQAGTRLVAAVPE